MEKSYTFWSYSSNFNNAVSITVIIKDGNQKLGDLFDFGSSYENKQVIYGLRWWKLLYVFCAIGNKK